MSGDMKKRVLVTGGTGLVGSAIREVVESEKPSNEEWFYISSKDANLCDPKEVSDMFDKFKPTHVIHLAAKVGGLFANMKYKVEFWRENIMMNDNIFQECQKRGVEKLVSCLSTCIFPDKTTFPIDETMIHNGPPHFSNEGYAYAKRMVDVQNRMYKAQFGCNFTAVIPTNIFGKYDNFHLENSHVIPGLIHRGYLCKEKGEDFVIWGSGTPLRQFIFSIDLAKLMIWTLRSYDEADPIILSVGEADEMTIKDVAYGVSRALGIPDEKVKFDTTKADGQYKKTANNAKLMKLNPDFKFTPFNKGIDTTVKWFMENYDKEGGIRK